MAPGQYPLHRRLAAHGGRVIMTETQTLFDEGTSSEELAYILLEPDRRRELLALAHTRSRRQEDADSGSVRQLTRVTAAATRSVDSALALTGLLDHIHLAHVHVMSARETLDALFALRV